MPSLLEYSDFYLKLAAAGTYPNELRELACLMFTRGHGLEDELSVAQVAALKSWIDGAQDQSGRSRLRIPVADAKAELDKPRQVVRV